MVEAVKHGFPQREIADAAFELQREIDSGRRIVVGVNRFTEGDDGETADPANRPRARAQADRTRASAAKAARDGAAVEAALAAIKRGRGRRGPAT